MAAGSMHIGSGPGVAGLSGMQVKLLVPLRTVRILPPSSMTTIVACLPTLGGAADSALAMSCASVGPGLAAAGFAGASAASAAQLHAVRMAPTSNRIGRTDARMMILLGPGRSGPLWRADIGPSGCPRPVARAAARRAAPRQGPVETSQRASGVVPGTAGVLLLSGFDPELEAVLRRRQRAGREVVERARRVVGLVEIERRATALRQRNGKEAPGSVGLASAGLVLGVGDQIERAHRVTVVRHAAARAGDETDPMIVQHEGTRGVGERRVVEDQRVR